MKSLGRVSPAGTPEVSDVNANQPASSAMLTFFRGAIATRAHKVDQVLGDTEQSCPAIKEGFIPTKETLLNETD